MKARLTRRAFADIERIFACLDGRARSPAGAASVKRALKRTIQTIETFPLSGRLSGWKDLRERPVSPSPYIVHWSLEGERDLYCSRPARCTATPGMTLASAACRAFEVISLPEAAAP